MADADERSDEENLAALVAAGYSVIDAAGQIGIAERTAYRISAKCEFKSLVSRLRTEATEQCCGLLVTAASEAVETLRELCKGAEKDSDRIASAKAILSMLLPLSENVELRRRLDDIERRATETTGEPGGEEA